MMIVEHPSEGLGLMQTCENARRVTRRHERRAQGEPELNGLLVRVALGRQRRQDTERVIEMPHGLAVRRPRHGPFPRLPAVR